MKRLYGGDGSDPQRNRLGPSRPPSFSHTHSPSVSPFVGNNNSELYPNNNGANGVKEEDEPVTKEYSVHVPLK
ncbi:hypothetical protein HDU80_002334, partial [Chytriomyces hyalinus]